MTSVSRARFIETLSARPVAARDLTQAMTGLEPTEVEVLAGTDHVFNTPEEIGALYDRLVEAEVAARARQEGVNLDKAFAVFQLAKGPADPTDRLPQLVRMTDRPRSTGVLAEPVFVTPMNDSDYVRNLGRQRAALLQERASTNVLGPEALAQRRILATTRRAELQLRELEAERRATREGTVERRLIEAKIDDAVRSCERNVALELASLRGTPSSTASATSDPGHAIVRSLPPYLRTSVEREGVVVPGVPGAFQPRLGDEPGAKYIVKF